MTTHTLATRSMWLTLWLGASSLAGCGDKTATPVAAAKVSNAVSEAQLTTVTLTPDAVRRLGITTAPVDSLTLQPTRTVGGEIVVPPGLTLTVSAPTSGTVLTPTDEGTIPPAGARVTRGQVLLRLAPLPPDIARAMQDRDVTAARLRQAEAEADRTAKLFAEKLVSARENERAQAELASARANAQVAAGQAAAVREGGSGAGLSALRITSPGDGVVRTLHAAPGQQVAAGAPLAEVMRMDQLWVRVPIYAGDARQIKTGLPAAVHGLAGADAGPVYQAWPIAAPPSADASAASVDLFFALRDPGGAMALRPGERVGVTLVLASATGTGRARAVPLSALVRDMNGGSWVYERTDSVTFVRRRVEIARVTGAYAVLAAGPRVGTRIVTAGAAELFGTEFGAGK